MNFLFDSNAILIYLKDEQKRDWLDKNCNPLGYENTAIISVVVLGELESLALKNNWGENRKRNLKKFLQKFIITDINSKDVINLYAEIDAFSQGKLIGKPLNNSARNMGKNDLWIAATASATGSTLITSDNDYKHLDGNYIKLILIDI